jgi:uncharacterized membrane protein
MRCVMATFYLVAGTPHIRAPEAFLPVVPEWVPAPREVVLFTGGCEVVGALSWMTRQLRLWAGIMLALYDACVFPANIKHALLCLVAGTADKLVVVSRPAASSPTTYRVVGVILCKGHKLAIYWPLITSADRAAEAATRSISAARKPSGHLASVSARAGARIASLTAAVANYTTCDDSLAASDDGHKQRQPCLSLLSLAWFHARSKLEVEGA